MSHAESQVIRNSSIHELHEYNDSFSRAFLQTPTREFLQENYTKPQLQKKCQLLGLRNIWVRKDQLIEMIVEHYNDKEPPGTSSDLQCSQQDDTSNRHMEAEVAAVHRKLEQLERKLEMKDGEIMELKNRLSEAEDQIKNINTILQTVQRENVSDSQNQNKKTLLIGDSTLYRVRASDLKETCIVRTIPEANLSLMQSWLADQLVHPLKECIIYCGLQDIMEKSKKSEDILDILGCIVSELKSKNDEIKVKICELVSNDINSDLSERVEHFNIKLIEWCAKNSVTVVKTELSFRLGTGEMDVNCFDDGTTETTLSRIGTIRLLEAIDKTCENKITSEKLRDTKRTEMENYNERDAAGKSMWQMTKNSNSRNRYFPENRRFARKQSIVSHRGYWNIRQERYNQRSTAPSANHQLRTTQITETSRRPVGRPAIPRWREPQHYHAHRDNYEDENEVACYQDGNMGCYNCGEFNHKRNTCRFDHRIKCRNCGSLGHKSKSCKGNRY